MTLDAAVVSLRKVFECGQGYVAVSRLRNLDALCIDDDPTIEMPWERIFRAHPRALEFYRSLPVSANTNTSTTCLSSDTSSTASSSVPISSVQSFSPPAQSRKSSSTTPPLESSLFKSASTLLQQRPDCRVIELDQGLRECKYHLIIPLRTLNQFVLTFIRPDKPPIDLTSNVRSISKTPSTGATRVPFVYPTADDEFSPLASALTSASLDLFSEPATSSSNNASLKSIAVSSSSSVLASSSISIQIPAEKGLSAEQRIEIDDDDFDEPPNKAKVSKKRKDTVKESSSSSSSSKSSVSEPFKKPRAKKQLLVPDGKQARLSSFGFGGKT